MGDNLLVDGIVYVVVEEGRIDVVVVVSCFNLVIL